jgi:hypothetical protein
MMTEEDSHRYATAGKQILFSGAFYSVLFVSCAARTKAIWFRAAKQL